MKSVTGPDLCHSLAARRLARYTSRLYDRHLAGAGLSISQFSLLALIERSPGVSVSDLAEAMVMERTTTLRALRPLIDADLVATTAGEGSRAHNYELTPKGRARFNQAETLWSQAQEDFERASGKRRATSVRNEMLALAGLL
jgi:DNA-binding MarR family transcriptional regulator